MTQPTYDDLKVSEELHRLLLENVLDPIFVTDDGGRFTFICPNVTHILGYSVYEIESMGNISKLLGDALFDLEELERHKTIRNIETEVLDKNGNKHVYLVTVKKVSIGRGTVLFSCRDTTERYRAERALKESERQFTTLAEWAPMSLYQTDTEGACLYVNKKWREHSGMTLEEALGHGWKQALHEEDRERVFELWNQHAQDTEPWNMEYRFRTPEGDVIWLYGTTLAVRDNDNRVTGYLGANIDITEHKRAEKEQQINESRLESLVKLNEMHRADINALAEFALEESEKFTQSKIGFINFLSDDEKRVSDVVYTQHTLQNCSIPQEASEFRISECGLWSEAYRQRSPIIVNEYQGAQTAKSGLPDGHCEIRRFLSVPVMDGQRVVAVAALGNKTSEYNQMDVRQFRLFMDGLWRIIKQRRAEKLLRRSEAFSKNLLLHSPNPIVVIDEDTRVRFANLALINLTGFSESEIIGEKVPYPWWTKETYEKVSTDFRLAMSKGASRVEELFKKKNGERFWVEITSVPVVENGQFKYYLANWNDITERKRSEADLLESEEKYRQLFSAEFDAVMVFDAETRVFLDVNDAALRLYGYTKEEFLHLRYSAITNEPEASDKSILQAVDGNPHSVPRRYHKKKDGSVFPVEISASSFLLKGRKVVCGIIREITERLRAEEDIKIKTNRLEEMNTALKVLVEHREKERKDFEKNIYENVKKLVLPYLEKLNSSLQKPENKTYLDIAKSNLQDLVSPFAEALSLACLSPVEFEVADMVRHGKTSKDIASIMNISGETVRFHRKRIRNKLGLKKKRINLRTYLNSLPLERG